MVFSCDDQSQSIIATILNGQNAERYECALSACASPVCGCQVIYLDLAQIDSAGNEAQNPSRHVKIDLADNSLDSKYTKKLPREEIRFAELFLDSLIEDDFDFLFKKHYEIKHLLTEAAKPDEIDAHFDYKEIERDGMMSGYNEVLPFADRLYVTVAGKQCMVADQYCLLPKCSCTDTNLTFVHFDPVARKGEEICYVEVNYKKRVWKLLADSPVRLATDTLRTATEKEIPGFYDILYKRHVRLKAIYAFCKKKHFAAKQPLIMPKVSRNDPCPCGSGKKFKKCCANEEA